MYPSILNHQLLHYKNLRDSSIAALRDQLRLFCIVAELQLIGGFGQYGRHIRYTSYLTAALPLLFAPLHCSPWFRLTPWRQGLRGRLSSYCHRGQTAYRARWWSPKGLCFLENLNIFLLYSRLQNRLHPKHTA